MKTVLFICNEYPPFLSGGIGTFVKNMSEQLVQLKITCLVAGMYDIQQDIEEDLNGVKVFRWAQPQPIAWLGKIGKIWNAIRIRQHLSKRVETLEQRYKPDLIESHEWNGPFWNKPKSPLLMRIHGSHSAHATAGGSRPTKLLYTMERRNLEMADSFISVSKYIEDITQKTFGVFKKPHRVIYNTVSDIFLSSLQPPNRNKNQLLFVGKFHERKGVYELMLLLNKLMPLHANYHFHFVGNHTPAQKDELLALLNVDLHARVKFSNAVLQPELVDIYRQAALLIIPSKAEAFGLIAAEAMACGCLVAMNKVSAAEEIIHHNQDGILINIHEPEDSAWAIHQLLQSEGKIEAMRNAGIEKVKQNFSNEVVFSQNLNGYEALIQSSRRALTGNHDC